MFTAWESSFISFSRANCLSTAPRHEVMRKALVQDLLPPRSIRPGIDISLESICLHALAREADRRFPTMDEFAERRIASPQSRKFAASIGTGYASTTRAAACCARLPDRRRRVRLSGSNKKADELVSVAAGGRSLPRG